MKSALTKRPEIEPMKRLEKVANFYNFSAYYFFLFLSFSTKNRKWAEEKCDATLTTASCR